MDIRSYSPLSGRCTIDGGGSSTAFASATGSRWVLKSGVISWANLAGDSQVSLYEVDVSASAQFLKFNATTSSGLVSFNVSDHGVLASATYSSRMELRMATVGGTFNAMFTGYQIGG